MKIIAMLERSAGNARTETKSFDGNTLVIEIIDWAFQCEGYLEGYRSESLRSRLSLNLDQAGEQEQ